MDTRWFKFGFFSWPLIIFSRLVMKICYFLTTPYPWQQSSLIPRYLWASLQWYEFNQYKIRSYFMSLKYVKKYWKDKEPTQQNMASWCLFQLNSMFLSCYSMPDPDEPDQLKICSLVPVERTSLQITTTATVSTDLLKLQTYCMVLSQKWSHCNFVFIIL